MDNDGTGRLRSDEILREALRKSFEDSLKAPPSQRLEDLMRELRKKEKAKKDGA